MIRRLHVTNFKSFKDVSLLLGRRNVLIGPNMAGKSNLFAVFRFLRRLVLPTPGVYGLPTALNELGGFRELVWRGGNSNLISLEIEGDLPVDDAEGRGVWTYRLDMVGDMRGQVIVQDESLVMSKQGAAAAALISRDPATGRRILKNLTGERVTEIDDGSRSALEFELPHWDGNSLRFLLSRTNFFKFSPHEMKQVNPMGAVGGLDERGANLSSWLMLLQTRFRHESFDKIVLGAKGVLRELTDLLTYPTAQSTVFLASSEAFLKTPVPLWQMSDGELAFIALLSLIFCPEELSAPLYCIEEPENHLHPRLLEALVGLQTQRMEALGERASQLIVTTHSLPLVDSVPLEDIVLVEKREGATIFSRPGDNANLREMISRDELGLGDLYYSGVLNDK